MLALSYFNRESEFKAQTIIAFQGFEGNAADNWAFSSVYQNTASPQLLVGPGNYGAGYSASGTKALRIGGGSQTCGTGSSNCINGASSGGGCNDNQNGNSVTFNQVDIACYTNVKISVAYRTHVLCTSPTVQGQGLDSGDRLLFEMSENGAAFTTASTVNGTGNCVWTYASAATCSGPAVSNPFVYSIPTNVNQISFRISLQINRSDEVLYIDNVSITGDLRKTTFSYPTPVCEGSQNLSPLSISEFGTSGTFSSSPGLILNSTTGLVDIANSNPGIYQVDYSIAGTICSSSSLTILPLPLTSPIYHD